MAVVPLPHPDSTVPGRSALYWLVPEVGARFGPSDSRGHGVGGFRVSQGFGIKRLSVVHACPCTPQMFTAHSAGAVFQVTSHSVKLAAGLPPPPPSFDICRYAFRLPRSMVDIQLRSYEIEHNCCVWLVEPTILLPPSLGHAHEPP